MDDADRADENIERTLAEGIRRAQEATSQRSWVGCYCGEKEEGPGTFCGPWCRDLFVREWKLGVFNPAVPAPDTGRSAGE